MGERLDGYCLVGVIGRYVFEDLLRLEGCAVLENVKASS